MKTLRRPLRATPSPKWLMGNILLCISLIGGLSLVPAAVYEYDQDNRLIAVQYGPAKAISYQLDAAGNIQEIEKTQPVIPPTDVNSNLVEDAWETLYFGSLTNSMTYDADLDGLPNGMEYVLGTDPTRADTDGDGMNDYGENIAGTDSTNADSVFQILSVSNRPTTGYRIVFVSSTNRLYSLEARTNFSQGSWTILSNQAHIPGSGGPLTLSDSNPVPGRAYRVQVELP